MRLYIRILFVVLIMVAGLRAAGFSAEVISSRSVTESEAERTAGYWTPERMENARPYPMPVVGEGSSASEGGERSKTQGAPGFDPDEPPELGSSFSGWDSPQTNGIPDQKAWVDACQGPGVFATNFVPQECYATPPFRAIGKVFFTMDDFDYSCSGASIGGRAVITAGHCVSDGNHTYHTNWQFVPMYYNNEKPAGTWIATQLMTFPSFHKNLDLGRDVGFAVTRSPVEVNGKTLSQVVGHLGFAWNQSPIQFWNAFGYPVPFYGGEKMVLSQSPFAYYETFYEPPPTGIYSKLKSGSSGGPWIMEFAPYTTGHNYVNGVVSFQKVGFPQVYSPYFDEEVKKLKDYAVRQ
jgi:hypothetical protein